MSNCIIIDYGSGNLRSAEKAFERAASEAGLVTNILVSDDPELVRTADRVVLPGVGAYGDCARGLRAVDGMVDALQEAVIKQAKPFFGICVGMQLMSTEGHEHGTHEGLGWIGGTVDALEPSDDSLKIPHMGWNELQITEEASSHPVLKDIAAGDHAYFVHSYHFMAENPDHVLAHVGYGGQVTAVVGRDNMIGTQFHPEKSQAVGLNLISHFLNWAP